MTGAFTLYDLSIIIAGIKSRSYCSAHLYQDFVIEIEKHPTDDITQLLEKNVIGTPGKSMRYQQLNVKEKLAHYRRLIFTSIRKKDAIIATCCFSKRETKNNDTPFKSFYIRYFSFKEQYRKKDGRTESRKFKGELRKEVKEILNGHGLIQDTYSPAYFYAYVDPNNERSARLCEEFGFLRLREFSTLIFSRFNPGPSDKVSRITSDDKSEIAKLIMQQYREYSMVCLDQLFYKDNYFVLRDKENKIIAGVQANSENWKIIEMPGKFGRLTLKIIPKLPLLNKLFKENYRFATFESIIYKPGFEKSLEVLFGAVLAELNVNSALMWHDNQSTLYHTLRSLNLGLLGKLKKEVKGNVVAKFINMNEASTEKIKNSPAFISSFDLC